VRDVVGLYLDPPWRAVVLCVDETSQIQALNCYQPTFGIMPGTPERRSHDYVRHGTTSLFAALDMASGKVIGLLHGRHPSKEFKSFLQASWPSGSGRPLWPGCGSGRSSPAGCPSRSVCPAGLVVVRMRCRWILIGRPPTSQSWWRSAHRRTTSRWTGPAEIEDEPSRSTPNHSWRRAEGPAKPRSSAECDSHCSRSTARRPNVTPLLRCGP
jgi:hypothetical protein